MVTPLEIDANSKTPRQPFHRRVVVGVGLWLAACVVYLRYSSGDASKEGAGSTLSKQNTHQIAPSIPLQPMMEFMNKSAGVVYTDHFPDCLYVLKQTVEPQTNRTRYILEQSMNDYWKHIIGFRKVQLKFNVGILIDMVELLNMDGPLNAHLQQNLLAKNTPQRYHHQLLHQRIYDAGGSLPFYAHWRILHPDPNICDTVHKFPIFRRSLPTECSDDFNYWLIPTAPIIRQIKKVNWDFKRKHMVPRHRQQPKVAVATTASEVKTPTPEWNMLQQKAENELAGKLQCKFFNTWAAKAAALCVLVFLTHYVLVCEKNTLWPVLVVDKAKILDKGDDWKPERSEMYDLYSGVLDIDHTSNLYPSLLCQTSVVLKRHPADFVDLFSSTLEPWVHYVPVKSDLSDIDNQVEYVLDPKNDEQMTTIVANANSWCHQHMVSTRTRQYHRIVALALSLTPFLFHYISRRQCHI